jgi:ligand-binding sensor domain-containing protein
MRIIIVVFLFFVAKCTFGQDLCFTNYNSRNGLPSSQVYDIFQDKNGDIWFATDRGLAKYNGFEFKLFDISNGLPSNTILIFIHKKMEIFGVQPFPIIGFILKTVLKIFKNTSGAILCKNMLTIFKVMGF